LILFTVSFVIVWLPCDKPGNSFHDISGKMNSHSRAC
jgi:hypothetical protein